MTYNFDLKPNRKFVRDVCAGLERHIDKYMLTDRPDRNTKIYTSSVNGKTAVVRFSRKGVSVESEDDLSEYFDKFNERVNGNYRNLNRAALLKTIFISLAFYVFNANALLFSMIFSYFLDVVMGAFNVYLSDFSFQYFLIHLIVCFALFFLTFKPIYEVTGKSTWRTAFIQSGGIFTVLHIAFLILWSIAYVIYKIVKESFVLPNFTVEQIEYGREIYNRISDFMTFHTLGYFIILLPLIISFAISSHRIFYAVNHDFKKNRQDSESNLSN